MRKVITLIVLLVMASTLFSLTGCGSEIDGKYVKEGGRYIEVSSGGSTVKLGDSGPGTLNAEGVSYDKENKVLAFTYISNYSYKLTEKYGKAALVELYDNGEENENSVYYKE